MELKDQLEFCRKCSNREVTPSGFIKCGLTHDNPSFENECKDYVKDPAESDRRLDDTDNIKFRDIEELLEPDVLEKLRLEQSFPKALFGGMAAGAVGAILWAAISYITEFQIGYMAIAIGILVGFAVKYFGNGFELNFSIMGATISLLSCIVGNLLMIVGFAAHELQINYWQILGGLNLSLTLQVLADTFQPMDLLFYALAVYEGFKFSVRRYTEKSLWLYTNQYRLKQAA